MSFKTILVHFGSERHMEAMLDAACQMAKRNNAHLIGLFVIPKFHVDPSVAVYVPAEMLTSHKDYHRKEAQRICSAFKKKTEEAGLSSEWQLVESSTPGISSIVAEHARRADLVIVRQPDNTSDDAYILNVPVEVMMGCGRPVLIVPTDQNITELGNNILVAWNGSREAARATFDALPLLKTADRVVVHCIGSGEDVAGGKTLPGSEIASNLVRHDVTVDVKIAERADQSIGKQLITASEEQGADLIVMGGYGHSRTREFVFGGATQHIMGNMKCPVFMAH